MLRRISTSLRFFLKRAIREALEEQAVAPAYVRDFSFDHIALERKHWHADKELIQARVFVDWREHMRNALDLATVDGLYCEFGVHVGSSMRFMLEHSTATFHGFDCFYGLPEAWAGREVGHLNLYGKVPEFPAGRVAIHKGYFEDTLPLFSEEMKQPIAFAHIDCDLYSSTKTIFRWLGGRFLPGSVIVFDEYIGGDEAGDERKAFLEFIAASGLSYQYISRHFAGSSVAVKLRS